MPVGVLTSVESVVCFTAIGVFFSRWRPSARSPGWVFPPLAAGHMARALAWPADSCLETIAAFVSFACCGQTQYTVGGPALAAPIPTARHAEQPA